MNFRLIMKQIHIKTLAVLAILGLTLPVMGEDCIIHIHTNNSGIIDVKVSESAIASTYGDLPAYPASVFYISTGQITTDEDGRPIPIVEDGITKGEILFEILLSEITEINFSGLSAINETTNNAIGITVSDGIMRINRVTGTTHITITAISGIIEYEDIITTDTEINLNRYGKGIHLITIDTLTFKILVQ